MSPSPFSNSPQFSSQPVGATVFASNLPPDGAPFKPSGRVPATSLLLLLLTAIVGGVAVGALWHFVANFFDLVVISALLAGLLAGLPLLAIVKSGRVRAPKIVMAIGLLTALCVYGSRQVFDAYAVRAEYLSALPANQQAAAAQQITPARTLGGYMEYRARNGITLRSSRSGSSSSSGTTLSGTAFWAFLAVETLLVWLTAGAVAASQAGEPFCEACGKWHSKRDVLDVRPPENPQVEAAIRARDWNALTLIRASPKKNDKDASSTKVALSQCPACGASALKTTSSGKFPADLKHIHLSRDNGERLTAESQTAAQKLLQGL